MWATVSEMLYEQAQAFPERPFLRYLHRGREVSRYTYSEAWELASRWSALLSDQGVREGEPVVLALPNTSDFAGAFFGSLIIGAIPSPAPPLRRLRADDPGVGNLARRIEFLNTRVLVVPDYDTDVQDLAPFCYMDGLRVLSSRHLPCQVPRLSPPTGGEDIALLQFTSGTVGRSKVVQLSNRALVTQARLISEALQLERHRDSGVSWLPLYHDMGLIGFLLTPIVPAGDITFMRTEDFIVRPALWMSAISEYGATITGGPPSAYALAARSARESDVAAYDLARLRVALVGAELVSYESIQQFIDRFSSARLNPAALMPCYGLAENGLAVTLSEPTDGARFDRVNSRDVHRHGLAVEAPDEELDSRGVRKIASVGRPLPGTEVFILDKEGRRLPDRSIGEIVVGSPSLMKGYLRDPEATSAALRNGRLWTGDLGYLAEGQLHIIGRSKEILIVRGQNYYPEDLEQVVRSVPGVYEKRVVAIATVDEETTTESVVMLTETNLKDPVERDDLKINIRKALVEASYPIGDVVLLRPGAIEYTQNGKLKRLECKNRYLAGKFTDGQ